MDDFTKSMLSKKAAATLPAKEEATVFYCRQNGHEDGPLFQWQIQAMLRRGAIRADAQLKQKDGTFITVDDFIRRFGCLTNEESLEPLLKLLEEVRDECRRIKWATQVLAFWLLVVILFGGFRIVFYR